MVSIKKKPDPNAFANLIRAAKGDVANQSKSDDASVPEDSEDLGLEPSDAETAIAKSPDVKVLIPIEAIKVKVRFKQPRKHFDANRLMELESSIRKKGIEDPLVVRPLEAGLYELVDGERRYRSAMNVGLSEVPVFIRELDDKEALEYSLTKFLLSEDLNPVEETQGILNLLSLELDYTQEEIISLLYRMDNEAKGKVTHNVVGSEAKSIIASLFSAIGMSWESFVNHRLPLLRLPESVLGALSEGKLAYTKAQAIARIKDEVQRDRLLNDAILHDLSLSQIQQRIKTIKALSSEPQPLTTIQSRLDNVYRQVKKAKLWEHPRKKQPLETLLTQMEELLNSE